LDHRLSLKQLLELAGTKYLDSDFSHQMFLDNEERNPLDEPQPMGEPVGLSPEFVEIMRVAFARASMEDRPHYDCLPGDIDQLIEISPLFRPRSSLD